MAEKGRARHPLRRRFTSALQARLQLLWPFLCPLVIENSFPTFHRGTAGNPARYNAVSLEIMRTADYTDVTDETDDKTEGTFYVQIRILNRR
jgi:hypothetical protein